VPKPPTRVHLPTLLGGCRIVGGINEQVVIAAFAESRQRFAEGKGEQSNDDGDDKPLQLRQPAKRPNHTQEKKLWAILYLEETYMPPTADRETRKLISSDLAAKTTMGDDEDGHKEVLTLSRMHTQLQAQVNRYYTAAENEEVEDDGGNCDDNGLTISSDVDSNQSFDSDSEGNEDFNEAINGDIDQRDENI
jgi:hypothetical protein